MGRPRRPSRCHPWLHHHLGTRVLVATTVPVTVSLAWSPNRVTTNNRMACFIAITDTGTVSRLGCRPGRRLGRSEYLDRLTSRLLPHVNSGLPPRAPPSPAPTCAHPFHRVPTRTWQIAHRHRPSRTPRHFLLDAAARHRHPILGLISPPQPPPPPPSPPPSLQSSPNRRGAEPD